MKKEEKFETLKKIEGSWGGLVCVPRQGGDPHTNKQGTNTHHSEPQHSHVLAAGKQKQNTHAARAHWLAIWSPPLCPRAVCGVRSDRQAIISVLAITVRGTDARDERGQRRIHARDHSLKRASDDGASARRGSCAHAILQASTRRSFLHSYCAFDHLCERSADDPWQRHSPSRCKERRPRHWPHHQSNGNDGNHADDVVDIHHDATPRVPWDRSLPCRQGLCWFPVKGQLVSVRGPSPQPKSNS